MLLGDEANIWFYYKFGFFDIRDSIIQEWLGILFGGDQSWDWRLESRAYNRYLIIIEYDMPRIIWIGDWHFPWNDSVLLIRSWL
jgi:hypothetical protein